MKAQQTAADLKKQLQMSNPDVAAFKVHFKAVQEDMLKLKETLDAVAKSDSDTAKNLTEAMKALIKSFANDYGVKAE